MLLGPSHYNRPGVIQPQRQHGARAWSGGRQVCYARAMRDPETVVREFCAMWPERSIDRFLDFFHRRRGLPQHALSGRLSSTPVMATILIRASGSGVRSSPSRGSAVVVMEPPENRGFP